MPAGWWRLTLWTAQVGGSPLFDAAAR
jgi:hypothetical protein